jgi:hypothetical protein
LDEYTVAVTNGSQGDVISFNPKPAFPATLVIAVPSVSAVPPPDLTPPGASRVTGATTVVTSTTPAAPTYLRVVRPIGSTMSTYFSPNIVLPADTTSPVTNGLLGWWKFDSTNGLTATDSSGNGNAGTLVNFPAANANWVGGIINHALQFSGSNYVSLPSIALPPAFTVTYWVNPAAGLPNYGFVLASSSTFNGAALYPVAANACVPVYFAGFSAYQAAETLSAGTWNFVAMTFNSGAVTFYINGNTPDPNTYSGLAGMNPDQIGSPNGGSDFLLGTLDNLKLFNRILSTAEISQEYNCLNQ